MVMADVVDDINAAVGRRWRELDPMLPAPRDLPDGCMTPLAAAGRGGRPSGVGVCRHLHVPDDVLEQVWGPATRLVLTPRLREPDAYPALDELLARWRDHLAGLPEADDDDAAAMIQWPSRDISGVKALLKHGMQAITVIAVRPAGHAMLAADPVAAGDTGMPAGAVIREARPDDLDAVAELEMGVVRFDAHFGAAILRPATEALVRDATRQALARRQAWVWVAERGGRLVGLVHVQPPEESAWIAGMTRPGTTAYLQSMLVAPQERSGGLGAALVDRAHNELDARGITTTLLHFAQMNPLSAPFWSRMGYRPLWTGWESRPAVALR